VGVDSTGLGDVVFDSLDARGLDVVPVNFASGNIKERMVRQLSADLEHGRAHIIEEMREEFESYEYNITPQGRYKFEAATGHDDRVSAKLIENWIAVHEGAPGIMVYDPAAVAEKPRLVPAEVRRAVKPDAPADIMSNPAAWG
jgi:hypothetical protein